MSNILNSLDTESPIQLLLLDLSAEFDTLDHDILTNRLREIDVDGIVLSWLISLFKYRTIDVMTKHSISITKLISTGSDMIRYIRKYINHDICRILVNSLAMSSIDYCCSILQGLHEYRIRPLTRIIRESVCLIFKQPRNGHSSITLKMQSIKILSMK